MFTGIIEETGTIKSICRGSNSAQITVNARKVIEGTSEGDSIAVNGVCLTVTSLSGSCFTADAMPETLYRSSLGNMKPGDNVNLERAMQAGGRFGGHIVSGHVDAYAMVVSVTESGIARIISIEIPAAASGIMPLIAVKGSVAVDGASLTVVSVDHNTFSVSLIPHTRSVSTLGALRQGSMVNVEADVFARYIARILSAGLPSADMLSSGPEAASPTDSRAESARGAGGLTLEFLQKNGF
ncbi:MAG: riboflavin synthase [Bacteroidetes bacterium]|uniref:Riboflavin synthase n=1 Tax=Candidatus Cryptobacteroides intestinavium TaxID=2840766 RepID=A0A9D9EYU0_9BACT|nr:riboflavin synthase [Candidatus Cryptobacteroides intestinavium]